MNDAPEPHPSDLTLTVQSPEEVTERLEDLRRQIDSVDERIVALLTERHAKVHEVLALKTAHKLPIYHPAREENLISRRREQAEAAGLDPDHVEGLFRSILRQSRVRQTVGAATSGVRPGSKALVVGGNGQMGRYFGRWFSGAGYEVRVLDVDDWSEAAALCEGIDLALISVPNNVTPEAATKLGPHLPPDCVLADLTNVKQNSMEAMLGAHPGPVIGLHPLFGPTTTSMDKQVLMVVHGRADDDCQWVIDQMTAWGNIVLPIDAREHDEIMNVVQGLRHFATFAFGLFLCRRRIDMAAILEYASPIYRLELGMVGRIFAQDASLYADMVFASPERRELLRDFASFVCDQRELLEEGGRERFCREFDEIAEWFGSFSEQAMRESSYLIDKLVERF